MRVGGARQSLQHDAVEVVGDVLGQPEGGDVLKAAISVEALLPRVSHVG